MKKLVLLRHAKSSWDSAELADFERPLNERGKKDAPIMGQHLAQKRNLKLDLIITSPAKRALKTAKIIAKELNLPENKILKDSNIYGAGLSDMLSLIVRISNAVDTVMLVGHNPTFTSLAYYLTHNPVENIPTCGVFCVDFNVEKWKDIKEASGKLDFFDYPKNI